MGDKIHSLEGNSPDCKLRSLNGILVIKEVSNLGQVEDGLGSSHSLKSS